ncbi:acyltransferase domain-containing protein [Streptomyces sp. NPDC004539]|uniref:acyltransferase domain-containing protein n=1 Tax=Streptomyces sp. NPDC004539 TaxID=3154280 RepID=UPI0033BE6214
MSPDTVLLFPGQGAYTPGCLTGLTAQPLVTDTLQDIDTVTDAYGVGAVTPLLCDPHAPDAETLLHAEPDRLQLAIFAASLVVGRLLTERIGTGVVLLGHSLGELTALTLAGAYSAQDGARVLCERDRLVREAALPPGGLLALGVPVRRARELIARTAPDALDVAAVNAPRQTVVSGSDTALERLRAEAEELGVRHKRLLSPYAYHNRVMEPVARELARAVAELTVHPLRLPVFSTLHLDFYADDGDIGARMCRHLVLPVDFLPAVRELQEQGADVFVEAGAGTALTGVVRGALGQVRTVVPLEGTPTYEEFEAELTRIPGVGDPRQAPVRDGLHAELRRLYAEALEYPEEFLEPDTHLETELGVDSVQQTEVLGRVFAHFGLDELPASFRITRYATLKDVADLLTERGAVR